MSPSKWQMIVEKNCELPFDAILFILNGTHDRISDGSVWASILTDKLLGSMQSEQLFYISTKKKIATAIFAD